MGIVSQGRRRTEHKSGRTGKECKEKLNYKEVLYIWR